MTQVGAPAQGEVLAARYRLDEILYSDPASGHALWRGTDNLLNRRVSIELRVPGGPAAEDMIAAAVTAGRIVHPSVVGVYDAVDEGSRAYVVREWVEGYTLLGALREAPLDPGRAAVIVRAVADALAAIHATGQAHGNLQPAKVLIGPDEAITLTELRPDPRASQQMDVRGVGALLYACLTGHWPYEVPPHNTGLPDAVRVDGRLCTPRQVRAGIPGYLDALTMDLLDPTVAAPSAVELASELRRFDVADPDLGPLAVISTVPAGRRPVWKRVSVLIAGLAVILIAGLGVGMIGLGDLGGSTFPNASDPSTSKPAAAPAPVKVAISDAILLDPPGGDFAERRGLQNAIDGDPSTVWESAEYKGAKLGGLKQGMGIILDLGSEKTVKSVSISFVNPGATFDIRTGDTEPDERPSDPSVYTVSSPVQTASQATTVAKLTKPSQTRYVVLWLTDTGQDPSGNFQVDIKDITVQG